MWWCLHLGREHLLQLSGVSTFWSANETDFKNLSPNFLDGGGCLPLLINKWHWVQKNLGHNFGWGLSPPHVNMRCSLLTIKFGNKRIAVRNLLYIHNSQKSKIQCFGWMFVSAFWSESDTDFKNLSSNFLMRRLSPPFDQQVTLSSKNLSPNLGVVST